MPLVLQPAMSGRASWAHRMRTALRCGPFNMRLGLEEPECAKDEAILKPKEEAEPDDLKTYESEFFSLMWRNLAEPGNIPQHELFCCAKTKKCRLNKGSVVWQLLGGKMGSCVKAEDVPEHALKWSPTKSLTVYHGSAPLGRVSFKKDFLLTCAVSFCFHWHHLISFSKRKNCNNRKPQPIG